MKKLSKNLKPLNILTIKDQTFLSLNKKSTPTLLNQRYHRKRSSRSQISVFNCLITPHPSLTITKKPSQTRKRGFICSLLMIFNFFINRVKPHNINIPSQFHTWLQLLGHLKTSPTHTLNQHLALLQYLNKIKLLYFTPTPYSLLCILFIQKIYI